MLTMLHQQYSKFAPVNAVHANVPTKLKCEAHVIRLVNAYIVTELYL